ncbi:MAG: hypothetical protein Q9218_006452 [Villophora microphyllina]
MLSARVCAILLFVSFRFLPIVGAQADPQDVFEQGSDADDGQLPDEMLLFAAKEQHPLNPPSKKPKAHIAGRYWLDEQDHTGNARGYAPFLGNNFNYPVYRNVKSYKAAGDGKTDDTAALQNAINSDGSGGNRYKNEVTTRPAQVFVPGGTYILTHTLDMRLGTILVGDPNDMPVFKASSNFQGNALINGNDFATDGASGTTNFFMAFKNIAIDTTNINKDTAVTALRWGVAQACHLTNIRINMPNNSKGHTGIDLNQGSTIIVSDISVVLVKTNRSTKSITGGAVGIRNNNQQVNFKNISFKFCTTALAQSGGFTVVLQGAKVDTCGLGIDTSGAGQLASVVILDSTIVNSGPMIKFFDSSHSNGDRTNQIVIENLSHSGNNPVAIGMDGAVKLANMNNVDTWIWGNVSPGVYQTGKTVKTNRSPQLLSNGKYFTKAQPTYADWTSDKIVNVKAVGGHPVKGDGKSDDSASLNAILAENAKNGKLSYFPYGVYIVRNTLYVPPGTRIVGEAWSVISGIGGFFGNKDDPKPVVMVGRPGESGVATIQDMRFTVADIAPGAIILQVNMAGANPGDVGIWNSHITVGGAADTNVNVACEAPNTADCLAAFAMVHLTSSSSAYIENMWGWTADHSLERGGHQNIATGRGMLVEATKATWLTGTGFEHNTLYNYNLHNAQNVFAALQQCETAYWQGAGSQQNAPAPWVANAKYGDPDFSWCGGGDQSCRMGLAQNVVGGKNLFLYGAAFWTFFHGEVSTCYNCAPTICHENCIKHQARVAGDPKGLYWYGVDSKSADVMVLDGRENPSQFNHPGGWSPGGVIAAYLQFEG